MNSTVVAAPAAVSPTTVVAAPAAVSPSTTMAMLIVLLALVAAVLMARR
jgi:hypothetical protein